MRFSLLVIVLISINFQNSIADPLTEIFRGFRMTYGAQGIVDCSSLLASLQPTAAISAKDIARGFLENPTGPSWHSEFRNWMVRVKLGEKVRVWQFQGIRQIRDQLAIWSDRASSELSGSPRSVAPRVFSRVGLIPAWRGPSGSQVSTASTARSLLATALTGELEEQTYYWSSLAGSVLHELREVGLLIEVDLQTQELVMTVFANP